MQIELQKEFLEKWEKYFSGADLPFVFFYSDEEKYAEHAVKKKGWTCMIAQLNPVRKGKTVTFTQDNIGCMGGVRASGYPTEYSENFRYFLSCGIEGKSEGLRLKKTPELVDEYMKTSPESKSEGKYIIFKRWDKLEDGEDPRVVIFYATPDILSGLFNLAGFNSADRFCVIAPFTSGCGSIINYPLLEGKREGPRSVIGMFDTSARPYVDENVLSFALPMGAFGKMVSEMDESFLITKDWERIGKRASKTGSRLGSDEDG